MKLRSYGQAIFLSLLLTGCSGKNTTPYGMLITTPVMIGSLTTVQLDALAVASKLLPLPPSAICDVTVVQINYVTSGVNAGELTNASGAIMIPSGANCPGPFPLVAFARATNVQKSHTNADLQDPTAGLLMTFMAAQGYAVVATDYLGYALSEYPYHPYIHADSEATSVVDSIRAARLAAPSLGFTLNGKVMVSGYSQGGHAAMATQRLIETKYPGEFNLVASAPLAGPYNESAATVYAATNPMLGVQNLLPFEITAWQKIYGNLYTHPSDIFNAPYDSYIDNLFPATVDPATLASMLPAGTPIQQEQALFKASYLNDLATNPINATIVAARQQDLINGWDPKAPTMLCGGAGDPVVNFSINAQTAYNAFRGRGDTNVTLVDVDPKILLLYGNPLPSTLVAAYHGALESPFCSQAAMQFFAQYK